jgi:hypothetical protein
MESPIDPAVRPLVERITNPLYDSIYLDESLPQSEVYFFVNPLGQAEAGGAGVAAANKNFLNTNMVAAGYLPAPRLFSIMGVSLTMSPFSSQNLLITSTRTFLPQNVLEDLRKIVHYSVFNLRVGNKDYLDVPTTQVPSNYGAAGGCVLDDSVVADGANSYAVMRQWWTTTGRHHTILPKPITIAPQQNFRCHLFWDTGGQAIALGGLNIPGDLASERRVWCVLHGEEAREVQ